MNSFATMFYKVLEKIVFFSFNSFLTTPVKVILYWTRKILSDKRAWIMTAIAFVCVIAQAAIKFLSWGYGYIQGVAVSNVPSGSAPDGSADLTWGDIMAFANWGLPIDELVAAAGVCIGMYCTALLWRLIKSHVPGVSG